MYKIIWSENVEPVFTVDQHSQYDDLNITQVFPLGNIVEGRRLFHAIMTEEQITKTMDILNDAGKEPKIMCVKDCQCVDYGYKMVCTQHATETKEAVYEQQPIEGMTPFTCEDTTDFFLPYEGVDEDGNPTTVNPPNHTFAGWG